MTGGGGRTAGGIALEALTVRAKVQRNFGVPLSLREAAPGPKPRPIAPAPRPARAAHLQRAALPDCWARLFLQLSGGRPVGAPSCRTPEQLTEPVFLPLEAHSRFFLSGPLNLVFQNVDQRKS